MPQQLRLVSVDEVPPGTAREVTVDDRVFAVFHVDGQVYVLDGICPHAGGPLGDGALQGTIVTCPWHGWQFDVTTGRHCLSAQIQQTAFSTFVKDGAVYVEI